MKLKIDLTNPAQVLATAAFFNSLAGVVPAELLSPLEQEAKLKAKRATKPKAPAAQAPTPGPTKEKNDALRKEIVAEVEAGQKPKETLNSQLKGTLEGIEEQEANLELLQDLVPKLSKASKDNIPLMRDKLIDLGAKRVSSLTSDKYQEFYDFLKTLENAGA